MAACRCAANYSTFALSKRIFSGSKYPKHILFHFKKEGLIIIVLGWLHTIVLLTIQHVPFQRQHGGCMGQLTSTFEEPDMFRRISELRKARRTANTIHTACSRPFYGAIPPTDTPEN